MPADPIYSYANSPRADSAAKSAPANEEPAHANERKSAILKLETQVAPLKGAAGANRPRRLSITRRGLECHWPIIGTAFPPMGGRPVFSLISSSFFLHPKGKGRRGQPPPPPPPTPPSPPSTWPGGGSSRLNHPIVISLK